jgi:Cu/Ag efflux protein CusF
MTRVLVGTVVGLLLWTSTLPAQQDIQRGRIKKVDADKGTITITVDGKDRDLVVTDRTHVADVAGKDVADGLKDKAFREGAPVVFKAESRDGKEVLVGLKLVGPGQGRGPGGDILRGKIKKLDLANKTLTVTSDGKDHELLLSDETNVLGGRGKDLKERLEGFKEGVEIFFRPVMRDGKEVAAGLKRVDADNRPQPPQTELPKVDTSKFKPLTELGTEEYHGYKGGLYPEGKNERPAAHESAGLRLAKQVQPLDADGKPSPEGKIVLMSVGMSNTAQASEGFRRALAGYPDRNPRLVFVNGSQGGVTAAMMQSAADGPGTKYWSFVDERLRQAGVSRPQVQAVWIKQADARPTQGFPGYAEKLQAELARIVGVLHERVPNLKLVYLSSRTYGGYATTPLNPEPYAYEGGFAVKWLIEQQIKGDAALNYDPAKGAVKAPWLSWGPYLWANGSTKRADGFSYERGDFSPDDGTHQSPSGQRKVGELLLQFFKTDSTTRPWFVKQ